MEADNADFPKRLEPLDRVNRLIQAEQEPFRKVHRVIDAIEVLIKFHTVAVVSHYCARGQLSHSLKEILATGLRTPSLGTWWGFCREFANQLNADDTPFFAPGARDFILGSRARTFPSLVQALDDEDSLIAFRNRYAHGATPSDRACRDDLDEYLPRYRDLVMAAKHLEGIRLEDVGGRIQLETASAAIDLHPLLVHRPDEQGYYFYNDIRAKAVAFLCYESAEHWRDRELRAALLQRYPIDEWSRLPASGFRHRIEELTDVFKGRRAELEGFRSLLTRPRGFLAVWGSPGVGKSSLLAQAVREWGCDTNADGGQQTIVLEYFIRRGQRCDASSFLANLNRRLEELIPSGIPQGRGTVEQWETLARRIEAVSGRLNGRKLVLVIDGLDEAGGDGELLRYLPRSVPTGVFVIYGSRPLPEVRRLFDELDRECRSEMTLQGLLDADVRALLYDHVSKYAIQDGFVEAVTRRSAGNPLFVKMLCEAIVNSDIPLNDVGRLPNSMSSLYDELLRRLRNEDHGFDLLMLLAVAMDFLSVETIAAITGWSMPAASAAVDAVMEVLVENPHTPTVTDYQLFHESLREHLLARQPDSAAMWRDKFADWCGLWQELRGGSRTYALKFAVRHVAEAGGEKASSRMQELVRDLRFRSAQYAAAGLQCVLDDLRRVARQLFTSRGLWEDGFGLLLMHADEAQRLRIGEAKRLRDLAQEGDVAGSLEILGKEQDGLARFVGAVAAAWELADADKPFLEVLLDAEKATGIAMPSQCAGVFRQIFRRLAASGLNAADGERILAAVLAAN